MIRSWIFLPRRFALELGADDLVDVEEAVLLEADLDERRLHPGQDVVDDAEVDVPGDRAALGPLEVDLGDAVVLEDRDALLADVDRDEELALRRRAAAPRRRRLALPLAATGALRPSAARASAVGSPAFCFGARSSGGASAASLRRLGCGAGLAAPLSASAPATAALARRRCRRPVGASSASVGLLGGERLRRCRDLLRCCGGLCRLRRPCVVETETRAMPQCLLV